ncbi:MAG: sugar ABC transporter permease [Chloroflexota bacterium]
MTTLESESKPVFSPAQRRSLSNTLWALLFLAPSLLGLLFFLIGPMLASFGLTFLEWDPLLPSNYTFIGLGNYRELIADPHFWQALGNTLYFIVGYIPLVVVAGLGVALLLNRGLRGISFFRGAFFMPVVSAWVAVALLWTWIFNPRFGLVNYLLRLIGIDGPAWLFDPNWAMPAIILTSVWKDIGFVSVLFLTGLQSIPQEYYEATAIDGASQWEQFRHITIPLLSPTTFFVLIISLINSFQVFDQVWIMTEGGPAGATSVLVEMIVNNAFRYGRMGYAATISWVLFALVFAVTLVQSRVQNKWVTYD